MLNVLNEEDSPFDETRGMLIMHVQEIATRRHQKRYALVDEIERGVVLFNKTLESIEESDLQDLVDAQVRESKELDYKEYLSLAMESEKKEFLSDVSSFANASGGYLIYGIKESKEDAGLPVELCGMQLDNPGKFGTTLENIIQTGLDPRLPASSAHVRVISLPSKGRQAIIVHIRKSWMAPHMVRSTGRFFSRRSSKKYDLDVSELRTAFNLLGTTAERIRDFRVERLSRIGAGEEIPALLDEQAPKLVLHMIPFNAFSTSVSLDLRPLNDSMKGPLLQPLIVWDLESNVDMRFNIDGIVRSERREWMNPTSTVAYTQVFRNGIIETVDISILGVYAWNASTSKIDPDKRIFHGERYERKLLEAVKRYIDLQKFLEIDPPLFIMVSFLGMKGYRIFHPSFEQRSSQSSDEIDRMNLIISEIIVDNFDGDLAEAMKPIFDTVWNAAGDIGSPNYDTSGKFAFGY